MRRLTGRFPRLELIWADGAYGGQLVLWDREVGGWTPELVRRPARQWAFQVLPRRWVVERTFAWLGKCRRLSKDYEALPETTEAWTYAAMTGLMLRRLARTHLFKHIRRDLNGVLPPALGNLVNLQSLSLYGGQLSGEIPPELDNLGCVDIFRHSRESGNL